MTNEFKVGDLVFKKDDNHKEPQDRQIYKIEYVMYSYETLKPNEYTIRKYDKTNAYWYHHQEYVNRDDIEPVPEWLVVIDALEPEPEKDDSQVSSGTMHPSSASASTIALALSAMCGISYRKAYKNLKRALDATITKDKN